MALGVGALPRICADLYVQSTTYYAHNLRFSRNIHVILGALAKVGRFSVGKLTVEQVAKLSGVSRSTVSRVINNHPNVKPGVRLSLLLFHTEDEEQKLYPRVLRTRLVDGVIVSASQIDDPLIPELINNHMPFVMVGRPNDLPQVNFVNVDNAVGAYAATSYLIRLGYKCIATITGPLNTTVGLDRRQGYRDALNDRSRSIDEALIVEGDFSELGGYAAMQRLIPHQPDAVFVASDTMAFGALRALREVGLSVPDDVAVLGFDDLPTSALSDPPLTTIRQPIRRVGAQAVEILIDILTNGPEPPRRITLSTELVIRSSCASRSGA
jgi:LacI family transcriptional regulator